MFALNKQLSLMAFKSAQLRAATALPIGKFKTKTDGTILD